MRYTKKMPATDPELSRRLQGEGWAKLREPTSLGMATLLSVPFMLLNGFLTMLVAYWLYPPLRGFLATGPAGEVTFQIGLTTLIYIAGVVVFLLIHELLHACFIPNVLRSDKTFWGIHILFGFVSTSEPIRKGRHLFISIAPFLLLSVLLPLLMKLAGLLDGFVIFLCLVNAMGSSVDCLNLCLVAFQVPRGSTIVNNGFETYFKRL